MKSDSCRIEINTTEAEHNNAAHKNKHLYKKLMSNITIFLTAFILALIINNYIIINADVPSGSMVPTIINGARIFGNRLAYIDSEPQRGDIIVFRFPDNEKKKYVKRIIGLPGETVYIADGIVYINGEPLDESNYLNVTTIGDSGPFIIPEDCYFVMGDNRSSSDDSRFWKNPFVHRKKILAKASFSYYPRIHLIK